MQLKIAGIELEDPLIISSGIVPDVPSFISRVCREYRPSAITTKTFTLLSLEPHRPPTLLRFQDGCYINAIGLGNPGVSVVDSISCDCNLFISVGGKDREEIREVGKRVEKKAKLIEINLSSPNRKGYGASLATESYEIVKEIKSTVKVPVFVKLGPWDNVLEIAGKALEGGADGLSLINTLKGELVDVETFSPILSYGTGGISGKCIYPLALRVIADVYKEYEVEIIGMGGVFSYMDVLGLMSAGAKVVGLGSVIIDQGYNIINKIRKDLSIYLNKKGLKLENIIGSAVKK
nr:dihydroorotate dehydrogenase PyrD [Candidatus Acidianus copahuensis]